MDAPKKYFSRRHFIASSAVGLVPIFGLSSNAYAQSTYPSKAIRLVVPYSAGGQGDTVGRLIAERLSRNLGQQVFVDNRVGASGNIGARFVAQADPDGYTLLLVPESNMLISPYVYKDPPFDPIKDFVPVGKVGETGLVLVAHPGAGIKTVADVVSAAKLQRGGLSYGTAGVGTNAHFVAELLKQRTGANLVHVPYKGGAPAMADVMGGQIPLVVTAVASAIGQIRSGKVVPIAVTMTQRSTSLPDVPTFVESGMADLFYNPWLGVFAPAKTSRAVVERLNTELNAVMSMPEIRAKFGEMGLAATTSVAEAFTGELHRDIERYGPIIKKAGITAE
jgi:tripartite-type tricarboxylate transporter receptor subunit TctC